MWQLYESLVVAAAAAGLLVVQPRTAVGDTTGAAPPAAETPDTRAAPGAEPGAVPDRGTSGPGGGGTAPAAPQDALAVLEGAAARYRGVSSLCADFRQRIEVELLGQVRESEGRLCQKDPDLFSMRFTDPAGDAVVADGRWFWIYYPSINPGQVIRTAMASGTGRFDFHREFLDDPGAKYRIEMRGAEDVAGRATWRIHLVPERPAAYRDADVWIDRDSRLIRRVRVVEENGNVRTITLTRVDLDARPGDDEFRFVVPEGADVVSAPGGGGEDA